MNDENEKIKVLDENAWDACAPLSGYLQPKQGFNHYLIEGIFKRVQIQGKSGSFIRVLCDAKLLVITDENGRETLDSPAEPIESELSLPESVGRKIRKMCEENNITFESLQGQVLKIYRTGSDMATRYPKTDVMSIEEFEGLHFKTTKKKK